MSFSRSGVRLLGSLAIVAALAAGPAAAATITVNSYQDTVADDGECTLREAITAANDNVASGSRSGECAAGDMSAPGAVVQDVINFAIASLGRPGAFLLPLATPLPVIVETVFIDGYSQAGAMPNTKRSGSDAVLMLDLRGDMMAWDCDPTGQSPV
jgi:CSLREA domain-containing protein